MRSRKDISKSAVELLLRLLFLVVPTMLISGFVLNNINLAYTGFDSGTSIQYLCLFSGLLIGYVLWWMNGRFIVHALILFVLLWIGKLIVDNTGGEFDMFYTQAKFWLYSTLFVIGWVTGFMISKSRLYLIAYGCVLMVAFIVFFSREMSFDNTTLTWYLVPIFLYCLYMLYLAPQFVVKTEWTGKKLLRWSSLIVLFVAITIGIFKLVEEKFKLEIEVAEKRIEKVKGSEKDGQNGNEGENGQGTGLGDQYNENNGLLEKVN